MERTMTVEEKIKKAQEIYNRRNEKNYYTYESNKKEKKGPSLVSRMVKQIIICLIIYGIFYVVTYREYFLSDEFKTKVQEIVSKNETLNKSYNYIIQYVEKYFVQNDTDNKENNNVENNEEKIEETKTEEMQNQEKLNTNDESIGGAINDEIAIVEEKTQEEQDIEYIKSNISFINPIEGTITSTFGWRNPTTATVPKYHTGLDIGAAKGTIIKSATDGTIILASSQGDYGNHYEIQIGDIIIIYAHCNKLYLKEGENVKQGQEIAEVGTTGNSTRSTFTF